MFNVGGGELLVIILVALIVLGPQRLPEAARQVGRVMGDVRRISSGFQQELKDAFDTDDTPAGRIEAVPLAKAVADADADDQPATPATPEAGPRPLREVEPPAGDASSVAPAVADALDEIVAPARPAPVDPPAGDPGGEGLGGERAAS